ncbi:MAG: histidine phosphatase family protein [Wujia sp.]
MKLYVTRHGQTQYNIETRICGRSNVRLTDKGIRQAEELADSLKGKDIDLILVSPLIRATTTAEIVSDKLNIPFLVDERLVERDYGAIDGTYEGTPGFMENWVQFGYVYPEGESLFKVIQRVYNFLDDIKEKYKDKSVMVISHGGVCRVINSYFKSLDNEKFFEFNLDNCKVLEYEL